jgi:hypothetical protein
LARRPSKGRATESLRGGTGVQKAPVWRVAVGRGRLTPVLACAVPLPEMPLSLVGRMSATLPIRQDSAAWPKGASAHLQAESGAPGWNRTSDTRFRKHEDGVVARIASCAKVLHGPRFCAG